MILLPLPPKCWDYGCVPPHLDFLSDLSKVGGFQNAIFCRLFFALGSFFHLKSSLMPFVWLIPQIIICSSELLLNFESKYPTIY
jgi:hypothetical protein